MIFLVQIVAKLSLIMINSRTSMPFYANSDLWPNNVDKFFSNKKLKSIRQDICYPQCREVSACLNGKRQKHCMRGTAAIGRGSGNIPVWHQFASFAAHLM